MKYSCSECRYTYDEAFWDENENLEAGKSIYELGDDFACPGCFAWVDQFQELREEILKADDHNNMSLIEAEHTPDIHFLKDQTDMIEVVVGKTIHPMFPEHYIGSISLHDETWDNIEEKFLSCDDDPVAKFDISGLDSFEIRTKCNIHGIWTTGEIENHE